MIAPATTAPDGSVTIPLSRAVVYWACTSIVGPKISVSPKEKQMNECPGNRSRNFLFIVRLPDHANLVALLLDYGLAGFRFTRIRLRECIHNLLVCQLFCLFVIDSCSASGLPPIRCKSLHFEPLGL